MLIGKTSEYLLKKTRAKAKMFEYNVPSDLHIPVEKNVEDLMLITIGLLGDISAAIIDEDDEHINELKIQISFVSRYFDSYYNSHMHMNEDKYLLLMASVAYYFGEYNGSSLVLANQLDIKALDLETDGIEKLILWLLKNQYKDDFVTENQICNDIISKIRNYFLKGIEIDGQELTKFRERIYKFGSPRELLFMDIVIAIVIKKVKNSSFELLPKYTSVEREVWKSIVLNSNFIKELWPSQRILGENGIYKGKSGVIQLPTSAGKTKAISLIIRSSFLTGKTDMATIVAPYRALCREISLDMSKDFSDDENVVVNEISDVMEFSEEFLELLINDVPNKKSIIVVTPEKLIYLLRQDPEIIKSIGVLIFDEGHLFDDPTRGTVYELLISTIISYVQQDIQKVLISAVIPNADQINDWLNGKDGVIVSNNNIQASERSTAFFDWYLFKNQPYGYLYFVESKNSIEEEFYVPRVITITKLNRLPREKKDRYFPEVTFSKRKTNSGDISIYLALKLCHNGGVAIFCGTKVSVVNIMDRFLKIGLRGYNITSIKEVSNVDELERLKTLIGENYGITNSYYLCADKGIFAHHANIANGIKISVEYAMKTQLIKLVICTSTLAQGVNLPIKYLLISSAFQAGEEIKVRDFHNLIGRTGRAGFYTEGSIILTEDFVYNDRNSWKKKKYGKLLNADNSEDCVSDLLGAIKSINIEQGFLDPEYIIDAYYEGKDQFDVYINSLNEEIEKMWDINRVDRAKSDLKKSIYNITCILKSLESFILSITSENSVVSNDDLIQIVKTTLAYYLASDEEKSKLISLFLKVNNNISKMVQSKEKRIVLGKTLLGINESVQMDKWVLDHQTELEKTSEIKQFLKLIFPIITELNSYKKLKKYENVSDLIGVMLLWIKGCTFIEILQYMHDENIRIYKIRSYKEVTIDDVVDLCETCFGYQCSLLISALEEIIKNSLNFPEAVSILNQLARKMKYGLSSETEIFLYEMGFADRVVVQKISKIILQATNKLKLKDSLKRHYEEVNKLLDCYPAYFKMTLKQFYKRK